MQYFDSTKGVTDVIFTLYSPSRPSDDLPLLWGLRATACRQNAAAMETVEAILSIRSMKGRNGHGRLTQTSGRVGCYGTVRVVQQIWSLLASCIEVMATNRIAGENGSRRGNCVPPSSASSSLPDSMPLGDGSDVNWSVSVLGRSLLCRCINLLRQNGDLQTLATVICVFGGSKQLVALMTEGTGGYNLLNSKKLLYSTRLS